MSRVAGRPPRVAGQAAALTASQEHADLWAAIGRLTRAVVQLRMDLTARAQYAAGLDPRSPRYSVDRRTFRGAVAYELRRKGRQQVARRVPGAAHYARAGRLRRRYKRNPAAAVATVLFRAPITYLKTLAFILATVVFAVWLLWVGVGRPVADALGKVIPGVYTPASATSCGPVERRKGGIVGAAWEVGNKAAAPSSWETDPAVIRRGLWDAVGNAGTAVGWAQRGLNGAAAPTDTVDPTVYAQTSSGSCLPCPDSGPVRTVAVTGGTEAQLPLDAARAVLASAWKDEPVDVQRMAVAIASKESTDRPEAINPQVVVLAGQPNRAHGLWQVMLPLHSAKLRQSEALEPVANANAAHAIYLEGGWPAWDVAQDGSYREDLTAAGQALEVVGGSIPDPAVCAAAAGTAIPVGAPAVAAGPVVETAIAYALAQQGKPYGWGAAPDDTPGLPGVPSYDCSSLIDSAYLAAGIDLPGRATTRSLPAMGVPVSRENVRRGDLVWTSSGHIGMALDSGPDATMVHAPQTGDVVKVSRIWSFHMARRIVTEGPVQQA